MAVCLDLDIILNMVYKNSLKYCIISKYFSLGLDKNPYAKS